MSTRHPTNLLLTTVACAVLAACGSPAATPTPTPTVAPAVTPSATPPPGPPTPTPTATLAPGEARAALTAARDTTLHADSTRLENSNGLGERFFAGDTGQRFARRALIGFDLSTIPAGATILSVELRLVLSRTATLEGVDVMLHRLTASWGEGTSKAFGQEGGGTIATDGDATWLHSSYPDEQWATPGGDFVASPSGTLSVARLGEYVWESTPEIVADVQAWLDAPQDNHGWLLKTAEGSSRTAKRFDSKDNPEEANRPRLVVRYVAPTP